jgi:hypothetical protein
MIGRRTNFPIGVQYVLWGLRMLRAGVFGAAISAVLISFSVPAAAQVSWNGYDWNVDRYRTEEFNPIGPHLGRSDVLHILLGDEGFPGNRDGCCMAGFYNTQGRKALVNLPLSSFGTGDLYIPSSWAAQQATNWQATGLWGEVAKAPDPNDIWGYSIISFSNSSNVNGFQGGPVAPGVGGRFAVFDDDTGVWNTVNATINYDGWNTVRFEIHPDHVDFFVNGTLVHTDNVVDIDPQNYFKSLFLNSVNNGNSEYDVFWSNVFAGLLMQQDPSAFAVTGAVPDMTKYYIYSSIGDLASRRGAEATEHFSPYDYVWAYVGGTTGQFDLSNSSAYDANTYFLRSGIDIIQPMESLRLGLTVSAGRAEVDADGGGSAESDNYSAGGYLTYATRELYVDVISEYAWSEWNVAVPGNGSDKGNVNTYVASGEVGTSLWMAKGIRVVPNASLLYLNSDYDNLSFGIASASFTGDSALIGRAGARVEYMVSSAFGGSRIYGGVSAVKDLLDEDGVATVQSPALPGGRDVSFGGGFGSQTAAQFNAGLDLKIAKGTRLYGDTSYLTGGDADAFRGSGGFIVNW